MQHCQLRVSMAPQGHLRLQLQDEETETAKMTAETDPLLNTGEFTFKDNQGTIVGKLRPASVSGLVYELVGVAGGGTVLATITFSVSIFSKPVEIKVKVPESYHSASVTPYHSEISPSRAEPLVWRSPPPTLTLGSGFISGSSPSLLGLSCFTDPSGEDDGFTSCSGSSCNNNSRFCASSSSNGTAMFHGVALYTSTDSLTNTNYSTPNTETGNSPNCDGSTTDDDDHDNDNENGLVDFKVKGGFDGGRSASSCNSSRGRAVKAMGEAVQQVCGGQRLRTRRPLWNTETHCYLHNFGSRVKIGSNSNFVLIADSEGECSQLEDNTRVLLRFGKVSRGFLAPHMPRKDTGPLAWLQQLELVYPPCSELYVFDYREESCPVLLAMAISCSALVEKALVA